MQRSTKIIFIVVILLVIGGIVFFESARYPEIQYTTIANTSIGTVEVGTAGNENATTCIALITGIHPRETLSMDPEIQAAREYGNDNVKIINYKVTVTDSPEDYEQGRANGESLVHDYVNPNVTASDADAVIISHSHNADYGEGFYLATPEMDDSSVSIAEKISERSDFNYYPVTGNETYKSTSAVLVSKPIAQAGYPTFVYEIPEDIWESTATGKTKELFNLIAENI
ncbi:MAG: hypothetical protein E7Z79_06090 [Methanobrevibacter thaueri]|uniref:Uncharacterized protein n=1 Tax=Methanobrevibacter thaueri TaxID=190975 RepID=A0A8T3V8K8_9EURY|nr:hypothetical protein [Methanobrevibacter thaueri]MBE6501996.1 hypothetical protein [Methanobrevibacter thaueri]